MKRCTTPYGARKNLHCLISPLKSTCSQRQPPKVQKGKEAILNSMTTLYTVQMCQLFVLPKVLELTPDPDRAPRVVCYTFVACERYQLFRAIAAYLCNLDTQPTYPGSALIVLNYRGKTITVIIQGCQILNSTDKVEEPSDFETNSIFLIYP